MARGLILTVLLFFSLSSFSEDLKKVLKLYEKGDHVKTEELILKVLAEHPIHPGVRYVYSLLYLKPDFQKNNLDSARVQIRECLSDLKNASAEIQEELTHEGLSENNFKAQLKAIEEATYARAFDQMTIEGWNAFIRLFPDGSSLPAAIQKRDSLAFVKVRLEMTVSSLQAYLDSYPESSYGLRVENSRDSLQFLDALSSNSQEELDLFVTLHPKSAYTDKALARLLRITTISGEPQQFLKFIQRYKEFITAQHAINFLFHLDKEQGFTALDSYAPLHKKSDSLIRNARQSAARYFPVFRANYVMMSANQPEVSLPFDELADEFLCEGWNTDIISGSVNRKPTIISKSGQIIAEGKLLRDLGYGLLLVEQNGKKNLLHKSEGVLLTNIEDVQLLMGKLLRVKKDKWALYSLLGLPLSEHRFDAIFTDGNFWFFEREGLLATTTFLEIVNSFPKGLFLEFKFEEYELVSSDLLVGFRDDRECMLKSDGSFVVSWGQHHIYPGDSLGYIRDQRGYALYGQRSYEFFPYLEANEGFVLRKLADKDWRLTSSRNKWEEQFQDSVRLLNKYTALILSEPRKLIFHNQVEYTLQPSDLPTIFSPLSSYTMVSGNTRTVLTASGDKLFSSNYESVRLEGDSLFVVTFRGKHGLLDASGKELLPTQFDYIDFSDGIASVLKKGQIGAYDLQKGVFIDPLYESKPDRFGMYYQLIKSGKRGLVDVKQNTVIPFEYDEINPWADNQAWVRKGNQFLLLDIETNEVLMEASSLEMLLPNGSMVKFYGQNGFGVLNNSGDVVIPADFSDIHTMGSDEEAIIVAEQALPEAGFHVITYYTLGGEKIYSHAYRKEDYEKVFCDE